jgi:hypothetical protein
MSKTTTESHVFNKNGRPLEGKFATSTYSRQSLFDMSTVFHYNDTPSLPRSRQQTKE